MQNNIMARTTINLKDKLHKKISTLAEQDNRSLPNMIETILLHYFDEFIEEDKLEMEEFKKDPSLKKSLTQAVSDYRKGKGRIV